MKRLIAAALVLLSTAAQAQPYPPPFYRPQHVEVESQTFVCKPPLDRSDPDPVVKIWVTYDFDATHVELLRMSVMHERFSGAFVDRFQQYRTQLKFDGAIYGWTGSLAKNPAIHMAGGIYTATDGHWYYRERLWDAHNRPEGDWTSTCSDPLPDSDRFTE